MKGTGNSTMKFANDPLWQKINSFPIDDPAFTRKLSKENNWDTAFTERAIREYKRFVYLCCTLPNGASPPPVVDEVWHLHILYSKNYWEEFCDKTLGRKLHHHPSRGGPEEKERHIAWLKDTIENYRLIFEEEPPEDIWNAAQPDIMHESPNQPSNRKLLTIIILLIVGAFLIWSPIPLSLIIIPIVMIGGIMIASSGKAQGGSGSGTGGCNSGGDSGGDSGCGGGGCGGCGGGD